MPNVKDVYKWEIQLKDGTVITNENKFNPEEVLRVSYKSNLIIIPSHDLIFNKFKFKKRFSRNFMKTNTGTFECLHVVVAEGFRFYLFSSSGKVLITDEDFELYL